LDIVGAAAIVTGGGSGLGEATARALAARGAKVVVFDRNEEGAARVASELGGAMVVGDVADERDAGEAVAVASAQGPLRVLVNCAGLSRAARVVSRDGTPFDLARFEFVVRVNLIGTFNCIRLAAAAMAATEPLETGERGAIVNTASIAAFEGQVGQAAYSASKAGIVGMTLPLARDLAAVGVRVNTVAPGLFDTPIYGSGDKADQFKAGLAESVLHPRRLGDSAEFASLVVELVTNDYLNGEVIRIDGGTRLPKQ
jgi:NAD(P)-dependent dehydrogenase (short-subunit alcohol dehydrogenase family)